jgi:hypothetical protein
MGRPGLGPAAEFISFASPKEMNQKFTQWGRANFACEVMRAPKGEPETGPLRGSLRYSHRAGLAQTRLRLKHAPA